MSRPTPDVGHTAAPRPLLGHPAVLGSLPPLVLVLLWHVASLQGAGHAYAFVPLTQIAQGLAGLVASGELLTNLAATLGHMLSGLLIGGLAGLTLGGLMGISRPVELLVGPLYHTIRQVPLLGLIPLIGLWFGNGTLSKVVIVSLAAFYPLVLNTFEGMRNVEVRHLEVARVLGFSRWRLLTRVLLPGALPSVWTGVMHALAFAWIATVGAELLFVAGPGLGGLMQTAQSAARMDVVVICVASIGITGFALNLVLMRVGRHLLRWRATR